MKHLTANNGRRQIFGLFLTVIVLAATLILPTTTVFASKTPSKQELRTERKVFIKKNQKTLKAVTLNAKGLSLAWKDVLQHKIKILNRLKKTVAQEKGTVYSTKQAKALTRKINQLHKRYATKLKKVKRQNQSSNIVYSSYINGSYVSFMKEKVKQVGNRTYILWGIHEHNGKFTNYGGHGAGFSVG
ncbi:hypothetical protein [Levilactobacillus sp. N40-8-2]|uniref:hypothetical protein n=1 Tax=Levilactobacillus muriae TaxID=3238987 RepID=UPI0038B3C66F